MLPARLRSITTRCRKPPAKGGCCGYQLGHRELRLVLALVDAAKVQVASGFFTVPELVEAVEKINQKGG